MSNKKKMDLIFFILYFFMGIFISIIFFLLANYTFSDNEIIKNIFNSLGSTFIVGTFFSFVYSKISKSIYYDELKYLTEKDDVGYRKIYKNSECHEFRSIIIKQIPKANSIKMYGIGLNVLWQPEVFSLLKSNAEKKDTSVKIIIADVDSENIEMRHNEESACKFMVPKGKDFSKNILSALKELELEINDEELFTVKVFNHYPTFSILIIDSDIYTFQYGYKTVGTLSPVLHLRGDYSDQAKFYRDQFVLLEKDYILKSQ